MERHQSNGPAVEEIPEVPHISTLSLAQLEAALEQQEAYSREALGNAFAGRQEAEPHREAAVQCDANAKAYLFRYEEAELVIHELRKALVAQNRNILDGGVEPGRVQALVKRQHVSDVHWCASIFVLKLTADASPPLPNPTCHGKEWHPRPTEPVSQ